MYSANVTESGTDLAQSLLPWRQSEITVAVMYNPLNKKTLSPVLMSVLIVGDKVQRHSNISSLEHVTGKMQVLDFLDETTDPLNHVQRPSQSLSHVPCRQAGSISPFNGYLVRAVLSFRRFTARHLRQSTSFLRRSISASVSPVSS
jgi:hypothetical protein